MRIFVIIFTLNLFFAKPENADHQLFALEKDLFLGVQDVINAKRAVEIDSFFTDRHKRRSFNGTVLFAQYGKILYKKAFGVSNFRTKDSLRTSSVFQLASVSKPLTAIGILMLYEQGKLDLNDNIRDYFPNFPYEGITIRMLLSHRSGLPNYMYFSDRLWRSRRIPISNGDVLDLMVKYHPTRYYKPDRIFNYSNTNFCVLAALIEKISGIYYDDFMKKYVFDPAGMRQTRVYYKSRGEELEGAVTGYNRYGRTAEDSYLNGVVGDKGIYSTVEDLFKLDVALYEGRLLTHSTLRKAFEPANPDMKKSYNYGLGWRLTQADDGSRIVYHTGWWKGFRTYFIRKVDEQKTVIVLSNRIRGSFFRIKDLINFI